MKNSKMILMISAVMALMSVSAFAASEPKPEAAAPSGSTGQSTVSCPGTASNDVKSGESQVSDEVKNGTSKAGAGK